MERASALAFHTGEISLVKDLGSPQASGLLFLIINAIIGIYLASQPLRHFGSHKRNEQSQE